MAKSKWYKDGIKFQCQGSGNCCMSRGQYGYVYLTLNDRRNMAKVLKISTSAFTKKFCSKTDEHYYLKDDTEKPDCIFLKNGNRCGVYKARPMQCRTWPFWPEVMNAKAWKKEVVSFCPGVNKGKTYSAKEIEKILEEQRLADL